MKKHKVNELLDIHMKLWQDMAAKESDINEGFKLTMRAIELGIIKEAFNKKEQINNVIHFNKANEFQKDCHTEVTEMMRLNKDLAYQDATNVWIFKKLAELELIINL